MTVTQAIAEGSLARADAEVLLAHILGKDRSWLIAHENEDISDVDADRWTEYARRRLAGEPVAHITGTREFFGRSFIVNQQVLIPRPSTEGLVELALRVVHDPQDESIDLDTGITGYAHVWGSMDEVRTIVDCATGSGCIAITIACERPNLQVIATDINEEALRVAKENAKKFHCSDRVEFRVGDALDPIVNLAEPFLLVSNPPYIPNDTEIMDEVRSHEPHIALFGGKDGTDIAMRIAKQAKAHPFCQGLVMECETGQVMRIAKVFP
jgi:release factor glutamine methyltransferase